MEKGKKLEVENKVARIAAYSRERLSHLPPEHKRFEYPHIYKVGLSPKLLARRNSLIRRYRQNFEES